MANRGLITTLAAEAIVETLYGCNTVKAIYRAVKPLPTNMQRYYALQVYAEFSSVWTGMQSSDELHQLKTLNYCQITW